MKFPLPAIGIDFGTTTCCMAWVPPGGVSAEIIRNGEGHETTPSVLYYGDDVEPLVGEPAVSMAAHEEGGHGALHTIKRDLLQARPFRIGDRRIQPVEAAAAMFAKLRRDAESGVFRGQPLDRAVVTHPSRFDALQRDRLKEAATRAGIAEVVLLPEPVAAAIAYERWLGQTGATVSPGDHILVYDFGGGTFDLAVLAREEDGAFREALVPEGLSHLGGNDLDTALASYVEQFSIDQTGRTFGSGHDFHYSTIRAAREWKERLTAAQRITASVELPATAEAPATRFTHALDRDEFEALIDERFIAPTIRLTLETFARAAALAGSPDRVGVVLIGGGTRVPLVERRLREALPVTPHAWDRRDLAVALGAAWHAHRIWANAATTTPAMPEQEPAPPPVALDVETADPERGQAPEPAGDGADPASIVVDADGNGDFESVAEAVAAAPPGATILIRKGSYRGSIVLDRPLSLIGAGEPGDVVLEASDGNVITSTAQTGLVSNLHIRQTGGTEGSGIEIASGALIVEGCDIVSLSKGPDRTIDTGAGINVHDDANPTVRGCRIHDCRQHGVWVHDRGTGVFEDNDILGTGFAGVGISTGGDPLFRNNRIHDGKGAGVFVFGQGNGTLEGNDIFANPASGISVSGDSNPVIRTNRIHDNGDMGIHVHEQGRGTIEGNDIVANRGNGITIRERADPIVTGNRMVDNGGNGLLVTAHGRGTIEDNEIANCGGSGILVEQSSDPAVKGNRISNNQEHGVSILHATTSGTVEDNRITGNQESGVHVSHGANPTISGNTIADNNQPGIHVTAVSKGSITGNTITGNLYGILVEQESDPPIKSNVIRGNSSFGIMVSYASRPNIYNNDILQNTSGIYSFMNANPDARRNRIQQNRQHGVRVGIGGSGYFVDNDMQGNLRGAWDILPWRRMSVTRKGNRE